MKMFFDSSSFVKRFIAESGSEEVDELCQKASMLGLSIVCFPEIVSALNRKVRDGSLSKDNYIDLKRLIAEDVEDAQVINLLPEVIRKSILLIESNVLRSLDSLHIACALEWEADLFISSDKRQILAAENAGLDVQYIGGE